MEEMDDRYYMEMALALAARGRGFTSPNPMVGAVIVKDGRVVGKGYHERVGKAHAEVNAIMDAGEAAREGTLYVTLEPCNHFGRTPPCTEAVLAAGIRRVVAAMADPNPAVTGGGLARLAREGVETRCGVCEAEAERLNEAFIHYMRTRRPWVTWKCAATLDGRIAARTGDARWVTGEAARREGHRLRHAMDAILVGIGTVLADDPSLTTRLDGMEGADPRRIILDTNLAIPPAARVLRQVSESDTVVVTGPVSGAAARARKAAIERTGATVLEAALKDGRIDLDALMDRLGAMGITSLLLEGGSRVAGSALAAGIIQKIVFFYAPKILGGDDGIPVCRGRGPELMAHSLPVADLEVRRVGEDIMVEGYLRASGTGGAGG